jgi:hypothetical protein
MEQKHNHWKLKEKDKWKQFYKKILPQTPVNARGMLQLRGVNAEIANMTVQEAAASSSREWSANKCVQRNSEAAVCTACVAHCVCTHYASRRLFSPHKAIMT